MKKKNYGKHKGVLKAASFIKKFQRLSLAKKQAASIQLSQSLLPHPPSLFSCTGTKSQKNARLEDLITEKEPPVIQDIIKTPIIETGKSQYIRVLRSLFDPQKGTVFFQYPSETNNQIDTSQVFPVSPSLCRKLVYNISESFSYPCIINILKQAGFSAEGKFLLDISGIVNRNTYSLLEPGQKINHFPGSTNLGRKDQMWKNISKMRDLFGETFSYCPQTYVMPEDYRRFSVDLGEGVNDLWILKPANSACGKGIKIIKKLAEVDMPSGVVVSKYIKSPHLISGYKYDLRVYVAVTCFNPLKIYIYNEGLVRFATVPYSSKKADLKTRCIHLTNYSINKDSPTFVNNLNAENDGYGSKWSFRALKNHFRETGANFDAVFRDVKDIIIKTLISAEKGICAKTEKLKCCLDSCYELYGFDILIDSNLRPWLLEVNIYPSLSLTSPLDTKIKYMLMTDLYNLIGISPYIKTEKKSCFIKPRALNKNSNLNKSSFTKAELSVLRDFEEEFNRKGNFERVFPEKETLENYKKFFLVPRHFNLVLWKYIESKQRVLLKNELFISN